MEPLLVVAVLGGFTIYATWAALQNAHYYVAPYLSPFYSPCIAESCAHVTVPLIGSWWNLSPAFLILWVPGGFRATCYYYRKAYYRSFWASPPACAVPDGHKTYSGETRFPLLFQNAHRYMFYLAFLISVLNTWDAIRAFWSDDGFGFGLGNLVLIANVVLLWAYTVSCHSCRHIIGGRLKHFSKHPVRYRVWGFVSKLNGHHMGLAWTTLASLAVADFYVMAVSAGWFSDLRFFN